MRARLFGRPPRSSPRLHSSRRVIAFVFVKPGNTANRWSGCKGAECCLLSLWLAPLKRKQPWTQRHISDQRARGTISVIMKSFEMTHSCALMSPEFDRQLFSSLKGDVTLIFSFLLFFSCNEMFTQFPSQQLWNRPAARTLSEYLSAERRLILFSAASLLLTRQSLFNLFTSWIGHQ